MTVSKTWTNSNRVSSFQPNYFYILSTRDTIQTLNGSHDIRLLPNGVAFSNIKPTLKYDSFKNVNKFQPFLLFSTYFQLETQFKL